MDVDQAMIVAGVGCRKGVQPGDVKAVILAALEQAGIAVSGLGKIATIHIKSGEKGIEAAASAMRVPLVLLTEADLAPVMMRVATRSARVEALVGVPSVAEAAALAAGGPSARLIAPRIVVGPATCALAQAEDAA
jgi:cobalt-precorrin 5A hydrolase